MSDYTNSDTARRAAVSKAWAQERQLVKEGKGTRDWSKSQQAEILSTGKCKNYEGHHKFSVKENPSLAGDEKNIQFLTRKEHLKAHNNNFQNDVHGRYDPDTGRVTKYADGKVKGEPVRDLSSKMADSRKDSSLKKYDTLQQEKAQQAKQRAAQRAKSLDRQHVNKETKAPEHKADRRVSSDTRSTKTSQALLSSRSSKASPATEKSGHKTSQALASSKAHTASSGSHASGKGQSASPGAHGGHSSSGGRGSSGSGGHGGHGSGGGSGGHGGHGGHGK